MTMNKQEKRLVNIMATTKSHLARNMAAEFMKTRGNYDKAVELYLFQIRSGPKISD